MIIEQTTYRLRAGKSAEFEKRSQERLQSLRRARGFVTQIVMRNADDPAEYRMELRWANREYRDRYQAQEESLGRGPHQAIAALLEGPPVRSLFEFV